MAIIQHLVVDEYGSFISKYQGRLRVTCKDKKENQQEKRLDAPVMHLETVLVSGDGVSMMPTPWLPARRGHPRAYYRPPGHARGFALCQRPDRHGADPAGAVAGL